MNRRMAAQALLVVAILCAVGGWFAYERIGEEADRDQQAEDFSAAVSGDPFPEEHEPDYTPAFLLWAAAGVAAICSTILFATSEPQPRPPEEPADPGVTPT